MTDVWAMMSTASAMHTILERSMIYPRHQISNWSPRRQNISTSQHWSPLQRYVFAIVFRDINLVDPITSDGPTLNLHVESDCISMFAPGYVNVVYKVIPYRAFFQTSTRHPLRWWSQCQVRFNQIWHLELQGRISNVTEQERIAPTTHTHTKSRHYPTLLPRINRPKRSVLCTYANSAHCVAQLIRTLGPLDTYFILRASQIRPLRLQSTHYCAPKILKTSLRVEPRISILCNFKTLWDLQEDYES